MRKLSITESKLKQIVNDSVKKVLRETENSDNTTDWEEQQFTREVLSELESNIVDIIYYLNNGIMTTSGNNNSLFKNNHKLADIMNVINELCINSKAQFEKIHQIVEKMCDE